MLRDVLQQHFEPGSWTLLVDVTHLAKKELYGARHLTVSTIEQLRQTYHVIALAEAAADVETRFGYEPGQLEDQHAVDRLLVENLLPALHRINCYPLMKAGFLVGDYLRTWGTTQKFLRGLIGAKRYLGFVRAAHPGYPAFDLITDDAEIWTAPKIIEAYELCAEQMEEYFALASDHRFKGVHGIGAVTATKLLKQYGNIRRVYLQINTLSPTVQRKLHAGKAHISPYLQTGISIYREDAPAYTLNNICARQESNPQVPDDDIPF